MTHLDQILRQIDQQIPQSLERLFDLLRFPSVATDPAHNEDCRQAALWLQRLLEGMGFSAELRRTTGQPLVVGKYTPQGAPSQMPHVLFYGHYDVQPADPMNLWLSPPFEPQIRKGKDGKDRIFARGACDDKGQLMTFLEASRVWLAEVGRLPFGLTVLIEGDEEGDASHLDRFLAANRKEFAADVAFVCDTDMWDDRTPAINVMLRGCIGEEVVVTGPRIDLHSGYYGGAAANPITMLSRALGALHDRNGKIAIPGFYDGVKPPSAAQRREWAKLKFNGRKFLKDVGLSIPAGEKNFSPLEQVWARPTVEINGIFGGYRGQGTKTVLPSQATAKITFRLVEGQNPSRVRKSFREFIRKRLPGDCKVAFDGSGGDSTGIRVASDTPWVNAARAALKDEWKRSAVLSGAGGSIPVVEFFKKHLGIDTLLVGFGKDNDSVHSPNEKYDLESYHRGIRSWARIIGQFAEG